MKEFFQKKNFTKPAIPADDKFVNNYMDINSFNEFKGEKKVTGFYYLVGKEDGRSIAFSKKQSKVVLYKNCC